MRSQGSRHALLACGLATLVLACKPEDANVGGSWACPPNLDHQCFFYDSGLHVQDMAADAGTGGVTGDSVRALFDTAEDPDTSKAPSIAYPLDETTEPSNIYDLDIQWHRLDSSQKIFRIRVESPSLPYGRYDLYTQCFPKNDGCHYSVPDNQPAYWFYNVLQPLSGKDAVLTVAGSDGTGGLISVSAPIHFRVSQAPVLAGLYYWSAHAPGAAPGAPDQGTTYRLAFGSRTAAPFIQPGKENPDKCEGCHAVSRDGSSIAFTAADSLDGPVVGTFFARYTYNPGSGGSKLPADSDIASAMIALDKTGSRAVIGRDNELWSYDIASGVGTQIDPSRLGSEGHGYFPEFSPDDKRIALTLSDHPDKPWAVSTGSIATLVLDDGSNAQVLVPMTDQEFHFYPSWSPDGNWVVFASAPRGETVCTATDGTTSPCPILSYDQPQARLRVAHFPDGRVYDLNRATQAIGFTSTLPKFAPLNVNNEMFITFNSKMPYGIEVPNNVPAQLWLSVLDFDRLPDDPSSAPVWLPFQSFGQKNHLAYWTESVPCRRDLSGEEQCGPDETCKNDECVPNVPVK